MRIFPAKAIIPTTTSEGSDNSSKSLICWANRSKNVHVTKIFCSLVKRREVSDFRKAGGQIGCIHSGNVDQWMQSMGKRKKMTRSCLTFHSFEMISAHSIYYCIKEFSQITFTRF